MLGRGDDERFQLVDCLRAADQHRVPGGEHDTKRLPQPTLAGLDLQFAGKSLPRGAHGVDLIVLTCAAGTLDPVDLDHVLARLGQNTDQPGAVVPGALQRPHPRSGRMVLSPAQHPVVAGGIRGLGQVGTDTGRRCIQHGEIHGVAVGVAPDDVVVLLGQHRHSDVPSSRAVRTPAGEAVIVVAAL